MSRTRVSCLSGPVVAALVALLALTARTSPVLADDPPVATDAITAAAPTAAPAKPLAARKVLVYTECKGFRHSSIPTATAAVRILGEKTGAFTVVDSEDPQMLRPESLAGFDALCLNNTTGEIFEDPAVRQGLLDFVRNGKGLIGIHAATDCCYQWPEFGELLGGYFNGHPWNEEVTLKVDEPAHPLVAAFKGQPFKIADEIYQFKDPYSRARLRVLLSIDTAQTNMKKDGVNRSDGDFAVSWIRNYGRGRVFYCSLGHREDVFTNAPVLAHYLAGIQFALGDLPCDAVPSASTEKDGWTRLLNSDDLSGWIVKPGSWTIKDGVLARVGGGDIWTEQSFGDFTLELEFKVEAEANSGVFFRTANIDDCVQTGIEMQVLDSHAAEKPNKHDCGAIYDCLEPSKNAMKPAGEWNTLQLTCRGPAIKVVLNGEQIIDMNLDKWAEAGKNPDGTANKFHTAYKDMARTGRIGFQDHGKETCYRNVRIKPLPAK